MLEQKVFWLLIFESIKLLFRAILVPGLFFLSFVLYQYKTWLMKLMESGMQETLASTQYAKIPMDFFSILVSILFLMILPVFIGQLELIDHLIEEAKRVTRDVRNRRVSKYKKISKSRRVSIKFATRNNFTLLFLGFYIPHSKTTFNKWYWRSFSRQSLYIFGLGTLFLIIAEIRPHLIWANFGREYLFTILLLNLLALIAKSIFRLPTSTTRERNSR